MLIPCLEVATSGLFFIFHHESKTYTIRVLKALGEHQTDGSTPVDLVIAVQRNGKKLADKTVLPMAKVFWEELKKISPKSIERAVNMRASDL